MKAQAKKLIVFGDAAVDVCMRAVSVPSKGGDARVESIAYLPGGSAANCSAAAAHLGIETYLLAQVGEDDFGKLLRQDLQASGVNTDHLLALHGSTGTTTVVSTPDGERTFFSFRGVNKLLYAEPIDAALFEQAAFLHLTGYSFQDPGSAQTALQLLQLAHQAGVPVSLDPSFGFMQQMAESGSDLLAGLALFSPNLTEAALLTGTEEPESCARQLLNLGVQRVIIKLGAEGCLLADAQQTVLVTGFPVENVVDTTGAGDAFCAGYLAGQAWGLSALESAQVGNLTASAVVAVFGGQTAAIDTQMLCTRLSSAHFDGLAQKINLARERLQ